jgi:hypothetical protein
LSGLRNQSLPAGEGKTVFLNNASPNFPDAKFFADCAPAKSSIIEGPQPALTVPPPCSLIHTSCGRSSV